ncbi:MAG: hypothetical protein ACJ8F7_16215 [Gemmataceae bacterium]
MYLLAQASDGSSFGWIIMLVIFFLGTRKICTVLGGNKTARDAAKRGGLGILRILFKK